MARSTGHQAALCAIAAFAMTGVAAPAAAQVGVGERGEEGVPIELDAPPGDVDAPSPPDGARHDAEKAPPRIAAGGRILAEARSTLRAKGCAAAAPAYRVVAAMGDGFEAAQHELGDCLMTMSGVSETETALFVQEGLFWLGRAAYAGNARAQYRLALLHASPIGGAHNPTDALKWALAYRKNPQTELYGQGPLPSTLVDGLIADAGEEASLAAEAFAAGFEPLRLEAYKPSEKGAARKGDLEDRREEFERRRGERRGGGPGLSAD